jgi:AraC-like DNA-binding protein
MFRMRNTESKRSVFSTPNRYGLQPLFDELSKQGISKSDVLLEAGLQGAEAALDYYERVAIFQAAATLCQDPTTALLAGQRQAIENYGAYGYALATSATLKDASRIGGTFLPLSGAVFRISLQIEGRKGVWRSHNPRSLGGILPFVAEFWRSSQSKIFSLILGRRFPSTYMSFPYPAPKHAKLYRRIFGCQISFDSDVMEWGFDATVMDEPCAHADAAVAALCESYCDQFVQNSGAKSAFQREVLHACAQHLESGNFNAISVAKSLHHSTRTFYRKLQGEGTSYQTLSDNMRKSVAIEYLRNTDLRIDEIASRCGYQDVSNFRKAFKRWTGVSPSLYRS